MCEGSSNPHKSQSELGGRIQKLQGLAKALHCPTRWDIIEIIGSDKAKTREISEELKKKGYELGQSGLYYHLSELREAGLIEPMDYVEDGKGAPEKVWKLSKEKIEIDLVK